ncbi:MAG: hypothetical protein PVJ77_23585, partial [Desulfobacterales bacterium]
MKRGRLCFFLGVILVFALTTTAMAADQIVLKLGHGGAVTDPRQTASETFAKVVAEKSGGQVKVEIFPASALGTWREMQEGLEIGICDIVIEDIGT